MWKQYPNKQKGFTLLEIIVTLTIVGIVMGVTSDFIYAGFKQYFLTEKINNENYEMNVLFDTITTLLKQACYLKLVNEHEINGIVFTSSKTLQLKTFQIDLEKKEITLDQKTLAKLDHYTVRINPVHLTPELRNLWEIKIKPKDQPHNAYRTRYVLCENLFREK